MKKTTITKKPTKNDDDSCLQKSVFTDSKVAAMDESAMERKKKKAAVTKKSAAPLDPYMMLSEKEREKVAAAEQKKKQTPSEDTTRTASAFKKTAEERQSGFSMLTKDIKTNFFKKKEDKKLARQEMIRKRTAAKYLKLILTGEKNEPELCPRIFAILLVWLIIVIVILAIVYFQTTWLQPFKIVIGAAKKELGCFVQMGLISTTNGTASIENSLTKSTGNTFLSTS